MHINLTLLILYKHISATDFLGMQVFLVYQCKQGLLDWYCSPHITWLNHHLLHMTPAFVF